MRALQPADVPMVNMYHYARACVRAVQSGGRFKVSALNACAHVYVCVNSRCAGSLSRMVVVVVFGWISPTSGSHRQHCASAQSQTNSFSRIMPRMQARTRFALALACVLALVYQDL